MFNGLIFNCMSSRIKYFCSLLFLTGWWVVLYAQINERLLTQPWPAQWITGPGKPAGMWSYNSDPSLRSYGVYKFRKSFSLASSPSHFIVHVSADNRYKLFVNGQLVSLGPARGDLYHWNFETVDLGSYLKKGTNTLAAVVWNDGLLKPDAQISFMTGFILQGNGEAEQLVNTDVSWKVAQDHSYEPLRPRVHGYYVAGPGELIQMEKHLLGWEQPGFQDQSWGPARTLFHGLTKRASVNSTGWMLVPSPLPPMELTPQRLTAVRLSKGVQPPAGWPAGKVSMTIPAKTVATIILDQGHLTNAYPSLIFSKGKGAGISISYAESMFIHQGEDLTQSWVPRLSKGNRNEVDGRIFLGKKDSLISSGATGQQFTALWWRTYRYVQLVIKTASEPLIIEDIYGTFTGYPFKQNALFHTDLAEHQTMMDIGWRTARLCAFETYMDCPYYEQLQYIGDARIQALVSYYNSGDDRLARHGLNLMDYSRVAEGITLSRYPSDLNQEIPTFSLWWIQMLHDYWRYRPDADFVKHKLPGTRQVLAWFQSYQQPDGRLRFVPYWNFTDWVDKTEPDKRWEMGMAPRSADGYSSVLDMTLMWTYQVAAELEEHLGYVDLAADYRARAAHMKAAINQHYWDEKNQLFADNEDKKTFSQHANTLAILSGLTSESQTVVLAKKMMSDDRLAPASIYFRYYLHLALVRAGLGNEYLTWLDTWRENIKLGMTTWAEISEIDLARSDCHAWGSSPNIEFLRVVAGIDSDAPGFRKVKIRPHLGNLRELEAEMPHPEGKIKVNYQLNGQKWQIKIELPKNISGSLEWQGRMISLSGGVNELVF